MALYVRCDGCGAQSRHDGAEWWHLSATKKEKQVSQVSTYDLCNACWAAGESAVRNPRNKIAELNPREVAALQQIWRNATSFDQSIGDIDPRP
jgi:hypothetical protein